MSVPSLHLLEKIPLLILLLYSLLQEVSSQCRDLNYCLDSDGICIPLNCSNPAQIGRGSDNYCVSENDTAVSCCRPSRCLIGGLCVDITS